MPRRAARPCAHPGCPALAQPGQSYCAQHLSEHRRQQDTERGSSTQRGYGRRWRKISARFLANNPICERCHRAKATVAHHIIRKAQGGSDDPINLQALCGLCHAQVHAQAGELFGHDR